MGEVIVLALIASLNPTLLAATPVMLLLERPVRLMAGWLLGAYTTSITLGLIIVFTVPHSSTTNTARKTLSPAVDIALGAIALAVAYALYTGRHSRLKERRQARKTAKPDKGQPRWQRELSKGSPRITYVLGAPLLDDRDRSSGDRVQPGGLAIYLLVGLLFAAIVAFVSHV